MFWAGGYASQITVHVSGGIEKIDQFTENNITYYSHSQFAEILGEKVSWDIIGLSAEYKTDNHKAIIYFNSPYISIDDTVKNIIYPAIFKNGNLYLPAITFIPLLNLMHSEQIIWDQNGMAIRVDSEWFNITDVALTSKANGNLIEIFLTEPKNYEIYQSEGNWLNVTIPGGTVNIRQVLGRKSNNLLKDINAYQFESSAQVSFRLKNPINKYTHRFQNNPSRIQISLIDPSAGPIVHNALEQVGPNEIIDKIIIDPGHGGEDYGAIGFDKTREKKIVLDIAKRLAKLIRKDKLFEVVLTRDKDEYIPLEKRAQIANDNKGDLFISIHANASTKRAARGFQVFFLAPANNDDARAAAQLENASFLAEMNRNDEELQDDISIILSQMIQTEFQVESADLADIVDKELRKKAGKSTKARGMDQAGFVVLNNVYMPSILVETAFITNQEDENLLNSKTYREDIAEAIYAGLKRFKAKYEKR